ncbi:hypothetical protein Sjap_018465 [Stephania japonica]|uniref:Uncharacterized protein n=1 Tax=Stephania japonica TaxID=461633 RepID=A0AAP0I842_9MAGN
MRDDRVRGGGDDEEGGCGDEEERTAECGRERGCGDDEEGGCGDEVRTTVREREEGVTYKNLTTGKDVCPGRREGIILRCCLYIEGSFYADGSLPRTSELVSLL